MAFDFNEMSKNSQWGMIGVICVAFTGAFYVYVWTPNAERIAFYQGEIGSIQLENQRTREVADELPELEADVATLESQLLVLSNILPDAQEADVTLRRLQSAAADSNLQQRRLTFQDPVLHDFYAEVPIELDLVGSFHDLALFFDRVSKFGRIVTVGQVAIQALSDGSPNTVQASCTASTFFFLPEALITSADETETTGQ